MFFNEPDLQDSSLGSGTDPAAAVDDWINNYAPLRDQGYKLGSAAPCGRNHEWTKQFESACQARGYGNRCLADFITTHVYAATVDDFIASVTNTYNLNGQRPVWVTEYACHDFNGKQCADPAAFVAAVGQWMDQQPWVERYSIFGAISDLHGVSEQNALMNPWSPYDPTSLWWTYVSA
jgi:hypothetical protein